MPIILAQQQIGLWFGWFFLKILLFLWLFGFWGWLISHCDKDMERLYLNRLMWNSAHLVTGTVALLLWLVMPFFMLGFFLALVVAGSSIAGYVLFRNSKVEDPAQRWKLSTDMFKRKMEHAEAAKAQRSASVHMLKKDGSQMTVPSGEDQFVVAHERLEDILTFALPRKAERIDLGVDASGKVSAEIVIDGIAYPQQGFDAKTTVTLIDYLKTNCGMDISDRRKKQTGLVQIHAGELGVHSLALTTSGSTREFVLCVRIDPDVRAGVGFNKLGLLEAQKQQLEPIVARRQGIFLVTCPPGHGLTTTLYSLMHEHDPYQYSIVTMEDDIAYEIEGVHHYAFEPGTDMATLNRKLGAIVRQDPQVIMLGKLFDPAMARTVLPSAAEARVYIGMDDEDTFNALKTWIKAVGDPKAAAQGLSAVIAQRLVRKLCVTCRTPYKPDPDALRKLNLPADKVQQLYKQSGQVTIKDKPQTCPTCQGVAYRGRIGVFEVMPLDDSTRQLIATGQLDQLRAQLRKNRMVWLQEAALARVVDGTTSIQEVTRALGGK